VFLDQFFGPETTSALWMRLVMVILSSSLLGLSVGYTSAWCIRVASSTTFSMVGSLNKVPGSLVGMLFWKDERDITLLQGLGIVVASISGVIYSYAHWSHKKSKAKMKGSVISKL